MKKAGCLAVGLLALGLPSASFAAQIPLHSDPHAREMSIINSQFGRYLASDPTIKPQTAVVDLEGKGVGSVIVRFSGSRNTCDQRGCLTYVLRYSEHAWQPVFARHLLTLSTKKVAGAPVPDLVTDTREAWAWTGINYVARLSMYGKQFAITSPASREDIDAAAPALKTYTAGTRPAYYSARVSLGRIQGTVVMAVGSGVCGNAGCPFTVLGAESLTPVLTGEAENGQIAVFPGSDSDVHDLAVGHKQGVSLYRFADQKYKLIATTFPSSVTPNP